MQIKGIEILEANDKNAYIEVRSGEVWDDFVAFCVKNKFYGIENLSLIPGTVGAAPIQNIGAYGVEVKDVIQQVRFFDIEKKEFIILKNKDCSFGYRDSIFKRDLKGKIIITSVVFQLSIEKRLNLKYKGINEALADLSLAASLDNVRKAVIHVRESKLPDPAEFGNAGSFFKNPVIENYRFESLKASFPNIPSYPDKVGFTKIPAAWLIDHCQWKGKQIGNAAVHKNQALVLINLGLAKPQEIIDLSNMIQVSVKNTFGISLHPEVTFV